MPISPIQIHRRVASPSPPFRSRGSHFTWWTCPSSSSSYPPSPVGAGSSPGRPDEPTRVFDSPALLVHLGGAVVGPVPAGRALHRVRPLLPVVAAVALAAAGAALAAGVSLRRSLIRLRGRGVGAAGGAPAARTSSWLCGPGLRPVLGSLRLERLRLSAAVAPVAAAVAAAAAGVARAAPLLRLRRGVTLAAAVVGTPRPAPAREMAAASAASPVGWPASTAPAPLSAPGPVVPLAAASLALVLVAGTVAAAAAAPTMIVAVSTARADVAAGTLPAAAAAPAALAARRVLHRALAASLQALEVQAVLLEVARHVLARQTLHVHELHDRLGHRVLDAEVRHGVDEALVQRRRPHQRGRFRACAWSSSEPVESSGRRRGLKVEEGRREVRRKSRGNFVFCCRLRAHTARHEMKIFWNGRIFCSAGAHPRVPWTCRAPRAIA